MGHDHRPQKPNKSLTDFRLSGIVNTLRRSSDILVIGLCLTGIIWFLMVRISANYDWPPKVYHDPRVLNLTKEGVLWRVHYGDSPYCDDIPCHLTEDWPESQYEKEMVLPAREFPLRDFRPGQKLYYKTRVTLPPSMMRGADPIVFHSTYIFAAKYQIYVNSQMLDEGESSLLNITIPRPLIPPDGRIFLAVYADPGTLPYQGLSHRGDIVIGPKRILMETSFLARDILTTNHLWFILPSMAFCTMFIFLYIAVFRNLELFYFIIYSFFEITVIFLKSGYATMMIPGIQNQEMMGMTLGVAKNLMLAAFFAVFFQHEKLRKFAFIKYVLWYLAGWSLAFFLLPKPWTYHMTDMILIVLKPGVLGFGVLSAYKIFRARKKSEQTFNREQFSPFLVFFLGASLAIAVIESGLMFLDFFGLNLRSPALITQGFDLIFIFVLAAFTAIEIGFEISSKQRIEAELQVIEERLTLAQSIQGMLLPSALEGRCFGLNYKFYYEPAGKLSGDWLSIWQRDQEVHLMLGDVVGKGPQAALAVAAIATTIDDCKSRDLSLDDCIHLINQRIRSLFHGTINTTFASLTMDQAGVCEIRAAAVPGWFSYDGEKANFLPMRGDPLGMEEHPRIDRKKIEPRPGTVLFCFTDGVVDTSKGIRALMRDLQTSQEAGLKLECLQQILLRSGQGYVHEDDRTIVMASLTHE